MNVRLRLVAFTLATIVSSGIAAAAENRCNTATLRGSHAFTAQGFTVTGSPIPAPLQGPFASAGTVVYDGHGNVAPTSTASFNGVSQPVGPVKGTYQVNAACTFTSKLDNGATFYAVIVGDGRELYVLQTTPGVVASGIATIQSPSFLEGLEHFGSCHESIYRGPYGFISSGYAGPPTVTPPAAGPLAGVGTVAFDPGGTFKLTAVRSANGQIDPQPLALTGKFTLNSDCTLKMTFDVGFHFNGIVAAGGGQIDFIETDPGTTFVVKAKKI